MCEAELNKLREITEIWRGRLMSISWFMRCLNEHIARLANAEEGCTGRFWEGRFKSQALLDEAALAACLAYVDLNPVRAAMADTPESADHTSVQRRIRHRQKALDKTKPNAAQPNELLPFVGDLRQGMSKGLPFVLSEYLELLDWTGRSLRDDKRGSIPVHASPILQRLRIEPNDWLQMTSRFEHQFCHLIGRPEAVQQACVQLGRKWAWGSAHCKMLFFF